MLVLGVVVLTVQYGSLGAFEAAAAQLTYIYIIGVNGFQYVFLRADYNLAAFRGSPRDKPSKFLARLLTGQRRSPHHSL
jgi:hypothetical protein